MTRITRLFIVKVLAAILFVLGAVAGEELFTLSLAPCLCREAQPRPQDDTAGTWR